MAQVDDGGDDDDIIPLFQAVDDERFVGFDFLHRQFLEMTERRVAGAESSIEREMPISLKRDKSTEKDPFLFHP